MTESNASLLHMLPSSTVCDLGILTDTWQWHRYVVPHVSYVVQMFRCVTTAPQHHTFSVQCYVFHPLIASLVTSKVHYGRHSPRLIYMPT